jgi:hypothetical protein
MGGRGEGGERGNVGRILFAIDRGFQRPVWDSPNNFESADERRERDALVIIRNYFSRGRIIFAVAFIIGTSA